MKPKYEIVTLVLFIVLALSTNGSVFATAPYLATRVIIGNPASETQVVMSSWGPIEPTTHGGTWGGFDTTGETTRVTYAPSIDDQDKAAYITFRVPTHQVPTGTATSKICVLQIIVNGKVQPGYAWGVASPTNCPTKTTGPYTDMLGRKIQFLQSLMTITSPTYTNQPFNPAQLKLRVLDGQANDSFKVYVNGNLVYTYLDHSLKTCPNPQDTSCEVWIWHTINLPTSLNGQTSLTVKIESTGEPWSKVATYGQLGVAVAELWVSA